MTASVPSPSRRLAAIAVLAALVVAALVLLSRGGAGPVTARALPPGSAAVDGIPERAGVLGDPRAPVLLTEYADLQCPVCRAFSERTLPTVLDRYVRTGRVRLALQPLTFIGPDSLRAAQVASGAERQGRLWAFVDRLYARQGTENTGWVQDGLLRATLHDAGARPARALTQAADATTARRLRAADASAQRHGIDATPSFTVRRGGRTRVLAADALDPAAFTAALDAALAR